MYALRESYEGFSGGTRLYPTGGKDEYFIYHADERDGVTKSYVSIPPDNVVQLRERTR